MNFLIYLGIFLFKIIEDALATLRLIVVSNGRKFLGAILQFIVTVIWIILTGYVLINFMDDLYKVCAFALGSLFGSYIGSVLEEKIALGTICLTVKSDKISVLVSALDDTFNNYIIVNDDLIMIFVPRKKGLFIVNFIKLIDDKALIISEKIKVMYPLENHI